jgi:hypothetical protein
MQNIHRRSALSGSYRLFMVHVPKLYYNFHVKLHGEANDGSDRHRYNVRRSGAAGTDSAKPHEIGDPNTPCFLSDARSRLAALHSAAMDFCRGFGPNVDGLRGVALSKGCRDETNYRELKIVQA